MPTETAKKVSVVNRVRLDDAMPITVQSVDISREIALGRVPGATTWNKFGYNDDIDSGGMEVMAEFGGAFDQRLDDAEFMEISSSSANDTSGGTGVTQLVIFGVGGSSADDRNDITDVITMNGTTTVTTNLRFWGINRMTIFQSGSSNSNVGKITATAAASGNTMATMPAGEGTTQQMIIYVPEDTQFLATWLYLNVYRPTGSPDVTFKGKVYSEVVNSEFEVYRDSVNTGKDQMTVLLQPSEPFVIGEKSIFWFEAETTQNNTAARGRFSGEMIADSAL